MMCAMADTAIVAEAPLETEAQVVEAMRVALQSEDRATTPYRFEQGRLASLWSKRHANGRTDADLASMFGADMTGESIRQRRAVWERFSEYIEHLPSLSWSHYYAALTWDDATEFLRWAAQTQASVAGMKAYRRERYAPPAKDVMAERALPPDPRYTPPAPTPKRKTAGPVFYDPVDPPVKPLADITPSVQVAAAAEEPPTWSVNVTIQTIRACMRMCEAHAEPEELEEVADELWTWIARFKPGSNTPTPDVVNGVLTQVMVIDAWNDTKGAKWCEKLTPARKGILSERIADPDWKAQWRLALKKLPDVVAAHPDWEPTIDWFLRKDTVRKLLKERFKEAVPSKRTRWTPPTVEEVAAYIKEKKYAIDAEEFVMHYQANGWVQGRQGKPIKDWKACVGTWVKRRDNEVKSGRLFEPRAGGKATVLSSIDKAFEDIATPEDGDDDLPF